MRGAEPSEARRDHDETKKDAPATAEASFATPGKRLAAGQVHVDHLARCDVPCGVDVREGASFDGAVAPVVA